MAIQSTAAAYPFRAGRPGISNSQEKAIRYRKRAEELRAIAEDWIDGGAQDALFKIARDYERMANTLERVDSSFCGDANPAEPH